MPEVYIARAVCEKHPRWGKSLKPACKIHVRNVEENLSDHFDYSVMKNSCNRCNREIEGTHLVFHEVDQEERKHRFGFFCTQCSVELLDSLKGKLEWFHMESGWKGYIIPETRVQLERAGLIHPEFGTQSIEIDYVGRRNRRIGRTEILEILNEICRGTDSGDKGRI